jgi:CRISPR-associated protein Cmr2
MKTLLIFSLGPVQSFIATARRAQDLWLGSRLLSELIHAGIKAAQEADAQLIYPASEALKDDRESGLPNKFVARCADGETARHAAQAAAKKIKETWNDRVNKVQEHLRIAKDHPIWTRQTNPDHLLEIYWAAVPWPEGRPYGQVYAEANHMLAARKNLRDFVQVEEPGRKCSLCGERQALGRLSDKPAEQKPNEYLCAVCAVKRFGATARGAEEKFPSTSSVATTPFVSAMLEHWSAPEVLQAFYGFKSALRDLEALHPTDKNVLTRSAHPEAIPSLMGKGEAAIRSLDGDLYFADTFQPDGRLKNDYDFEEVLGVLEKADVAGKTLEALREAVLEKTGQRPTPYYAVLLMDGDRMGQLLAGVQNVEEHQGISQALFLFASQEVPRIVEEEHPGRLVYAGGDDVLAFLPVSHVLAAAQELETAFARALAGGTLSAGIAIAHHLSPLQAVLDEARAAEHAAKDDYNRKALCVALLRRSGVAARVGTRWTFDCGQETIHILENVRKRMVNGDLSGKLAYDVAEIVPVLGAGEIPRDARLAEMRRLLRRHTRDGLPDDEKRTIENLAEPLVALAEALDGLPHCQRDDTLNGMMEVANWLLLARFLAKEGRDEG